MQGGYYATTLNMTVQTVACHPGSISRTIVSAPDAVPWEDRHCTSKHFLLWSIHKLRRLIFYYLLNSPLPYPESTHLLPVVYNYNRLLAGPLDFPIESTSVMDAPYYELRCVGCTSIFSWLLFHFLTLSLAASQQCARACVRLFS